MQAKGLSVGTRRGGVLTRHRVAGRERLWVPVRALCVWKCFPGGVTLWMGAGRVLCHLTSYQHCHSFLCVSNIR